MSLWQQLRRQYRRYFENPMRPRLDVASAPLRRSKAFNPATPPPSPPDATTTELWRRWNLRRKQMPALSWQRFVQDLRIEDRRLSQAIDKLEHELLNLNRTPRFKP